MFQEQMEKHCSLLVQFSQVFIVFSLKLENMHTLHSHNHCSLFLFLMNFYAMVGIAINSTIIGVVFGIIAEQDALQTSFAAKYNAAQLHMDAHNLPPT